MRYTVDGMTYKEYVAYLIRTYHLDRYDAEREATEAFRESEEA